MVSASGNITSFSFCSFCRRVYEAMAAHQLADFLRIGIAWPPRRKSLLIHAGGKRSCSIVEMGCNRDYGMAGKNRPDTQRCHVSGFAGMRFDSADFKETGNVDIWHMDAESLHGGTAINARLSCKTCNFLSDKLIENKLMKMTMMWTAIMCSISEPPMGGRRKVKSLLDRQSKKIRG